MKNFINLPAPAKLNLFLHVLGERQDGFHLLESVFQLVDLCDYISIEDNDTGLISRKGDIEWDAEKDLCVRAARRLQQLRPHKGATIEVTKNIPAGAGLGGGSSDAATVLVGLNLMWKLGLSRNQLMKIGQELGADVPFFIFGQTAFVEGIGEILAPIDVPPLYFLIIFPNAHTSTADVFRSPLLKKSQSLKLKPTVNLQREMQAYSATPFGRNDLQSVAVALNPKIAEAIKFLESFGTPRMTGSGSAVFTSLGKLTKSVDSKTCPEGWKMWYSKGIQKHPLYEWIPKQDL